MKNWVLFYMIFNTPEIAWGYELEMINSVVFG
jgi:hypothetical protein